MAREYKVVVFTGNAKYTYTGTFDSITEAARYYEQHFNAEVIEVKALNVRLHG